MITNFQIWVYEENMCPFISMVFFYDYKFSNMVYRGMGVFFCLRLKVFVLDSTKTHYLLSRFLKKMKTCCYKITVQTLYHKPGDKKLDDNVLCTVCHPF